MKKIKISPSILSCDFGYLANDVKKVEEAHVEMLHIDVMDGCFVPNISLGMPVIKSLRKHTNVFFDVHLMIVNPEIHIKSFCDSGADLITFHLEAARDIEKTIELIREQGKKVGISIKPNTPAKDVLPYLSLIDLVLIMTVEPGFGGQAFMADMCPKIKEISDYCLKNSFEIDIQVDGGIDTKTAPLVVLAGANVLVAGSSIFGKPDITKAANELREVAQNA